MQPALLQVEGTKFEGGGGLIRESLTYSTVLDRPIRINNIRAGRPGKGGLRKEHTVSVDTIARLCGASIEGNVDASRTLTFYPRAVPPSLPKDGVIDRNIEGAAAIFMVAMLPYMLFANLANSQRREDAEKSPGNGLTFRINAGTLCIKAPSFGYVQQVMLPWFRVIGIGEHIRLSDHHEQGWHTDFVKVPGFMKVHITPLKIALPAFQLHGRGRIIRVRATVHTPPEMQDVTKAQVAQNLRFSFGAAVEVVVDVAHSTLPGQYHMLLTAETEGPWAILGYEQVYPAKEGFPEHLEDDSERLVRHLSRLCIRGLQDELRHGKAVDEHMENFLIPYQVFANGFSSTTGTSASPRQEDDIFGDPGLDYAYDASSLHHDTSLYIAKEVAGVEFVTEKGQFGCHGLGIGARSSIFTS